MSPSDPRVEVVVDTPRGSRNKYKHDEARDLYLLHKVLPAGMAFPFDFGYVAGTLGDDGDALDVLVIGETPTFVGCRIPVRLLGVIRAEQTEKGETIRNDRLVATAETEKIHPEARSLDDLARGLVDQIEMFFVAYNRAEGRTFVPTGRGGPEEAARLLTEGRRRKRGGSPPDRNGKNGRTRRDSEGGAARRDSQSGAAGRDSQSGAARRDAQSGAGRGSRRRAAGRS